MRLNETKYDYISLSEAIAEISDCILISPIKDRYKVKDEITLLCPICNKPFNNKIEWFFNKKHKCCYKCAKLKSAKKRSISIDKIKSMFEDEGCEILSGIETYEHNQDRFTLKCPEGHIYDTNWVNFKSGRRCAKCNGAAKYTYEEVKDIIFKSGSKMLSNEYVNCKQRIWIECRCGELLYTSFDAYKHSINEDSIHYCIKCSGELIRGNKHKNWKGGITKINVFIRERINQWKRDSLVNSNFKCDITNSKNNIIVHHLYGFNLIVQEAFKQLNLPILDEVHYYTDKELNLISTKCIDLHYEYGLGVCLTKKIHKQFHKIYGRGDNTPEQYYEFKNNYLQQVERSETAALADLLD